MGTIKKFEDLEIWQLARLYHKKIIDIAKTTALAKDFKLKDQIEASSGSCMDNIAEGFGRGSRLEFIQFLSIAKASLDESVSQVFRITDKQYISSETFEELKTDAATLGNKISALMQYLNKTTHKGQKFMNRAVPANSKPQTPNETIVKTASAATPLGAYPHARKVGNLLFLSGIGSRRAEDNIIPGLELDADGNIIKYDIEAECHSVFANVKAVLEASGSSWDKMVDVTVFLTNMKKDFPVYNKIYGEYFKEVEACRTTVEVKSLPTPIAIELKVIATI
ncbi:MAG: four helix bundle protein [Ferruginibacter sp.]